MRYPLGLHFSRLALPKMVAKSLAGDHCTDSGSVVDYSGQQRPMSRQGAVGPGRAKGVCYEGDALEKSPLGWRREIC